MTFKLLSLNCWGGRVFSPLVAYLQETDADVLCLQEMYSAPHETPSPLQVEEDQLPYPRLYEVLKEKLGDAYEGAFFPFAHGYLHDGATTDYQVRFGIATFIKREYSRIREEVSFVHESFRSRPGGKPPLPRNAHCVRLWRHDAGKPLTFAHMHGLWEPNDKVDTPLRHCQAERFRKLIETVAEPTDEVIACGDFNVLPESETFDTLAGLGLTDEVMRSGYSDTRTSYYKKAVRYADYLLTSSEVSAKKFEVVTEPEVSDHRPLVLEIE